MQKTNFKIIYSMRVHLQLQSIGFKCLMEMKNPQNGNFNCWVYDRTPEFMAALSEIIGGGSDGK